MAWVCLANVGIPMVLPQFFMMAFMILPVAALEMVVSKRFINRPWRSLWKDWVKANVATTLIGVPIAWGLMLILQISHPSGGGLLGLDTPESRLTTVLVQSAWVMPYSHHAGWLMGAAMTILLVPSFLLSIVIEGWRLQRVWLPVASLKRVWLTVLLANAISYACLATWTGWSAWKSAEQAIKNHPLPSKRSFDEESMREE